MIWTKTLILIAPAVGVLLAGIGVGANGIAFFNDDIKRFLISISTIVLGISLMISPMIEELHSENCKCPIHYNIIGDINGVGIYQRDGSLHYYDYEKKQYIEITQEDETSYTYEEYLENQLKEIEKYTKKRR